MYIYICILCDCFLQLWPLTKILWICPRDLPRSQKTTIHKVVFRCGNRRHLHKFHCFDDDADADPTLMCIVRDHQSWPIQFLGLRGQPQIQRSPGENKILERAGHGPPPRVLQGGRLKIFFHQFAIILARLTIGFAIVWNISYKNGVLLENYTDCWISAKLVPGGKWMVKSSCAHMMDH